MSTKVTKPMAANMDAAIHRNMRRSRWFRTTPVGTAQQELQPRLRPWQARKATDGVRCVSIPKDLFLSVVKEKNEALLVAAIKAKFGDVTIDTICPLSTRFDANSKRGIVKLFVCSPHWEGVSDRPLRMKWSL